MRKFLKVFDRPVEVREYSILNVDHIEKISDCEQAITLLRMSGCEDLENDFEVVEIPLSEFEKVFTKFLMSDEPLLDCTKIASSNPENKKG